MTLTTVLIDHNPLFREGLKRMLEKEGMITVVAEGSTGDDILALYEEHLPDILLVDSNVPHEDGIEAINDLIIKQPEARVAVLSSWVDPVTINRALLAGVSGFILKEMDIGPIMQAMEVITQGESYLHPRVVPCFLAELHRLSESEESSTFYQPHISRPYHLLSRREIEVLELMAEGLSNRAIAETLFIADPTVKNHVSRILDKMHMNDRTQAVVTAIKKGWVKL